MRILWTLIFYLLVSFLFWNCTNEPNHTNQVMSTYEDFEKFEEEANNYPEKFLNNPDSFVSSYHLIPQNETQNEIYAYTLSTIAYTLREHGDIYNSIKYYERTIDFLKTNNVEDFDINLYVFKPLAALYIQIDDTDKSILLLENLIPRLEKRDRKYKIGFINNLANAYIYKTEYQKAIELLLPEITNYYDNLTSALLHNTLSNAYHKTGDIEESKYFNKKAIHAFEKIDLKADTLIWYASSLAHYAEINQSIIHIEKAQSILNKQFPKSHNRTKSKFHLILANIYNSKEDYLNAKKHYLITQELLKKNDNKYVLDYTYTQALIGLAKCYEKLKKIDLAFTYYEWAIENDFRTQQVISSAEDQLRNNLWNKDILENLISLYQELPANIENTKTLLWCIELSKARLLINEINRSNHWYTNDNQHRNIEELRKLYLKMDTSESKSSKELIQKQIKSRLIEFQLDEKYFENFKYTPHKETFFKVLHAQKANYYSFYIHSNNDISILYNTKDDVLYKKTDANIIDSLQNFKQQYLSSTPQNFNNNPQEYYKKATFLTENLLPTIKSCEKNIFISLDNILYGLPFDALTTENDFLVQKHNIAYLNSFILFDFIQEKENPNSPITILFRSEYEHPLPNLTYVNKEIENLNKNYKTQVLSYEKQLDREINKEFSQSKIIHIAAHTILDSVEPPMILLKNKISTNQLRFFDIKSPLVFLSACNTGQGKPLPSEGMESLQRVFLSKNVPSVISTYWMANDETMLKMTSLFYKILYENSDPIFALAEAKRTYLASANLHQQNPWYWSNINYSGIGNQIFVETNVKSYLFYFILIILSACFIIKLKKLRLNSSFIHKNKVSDNKTK